MSRLAAGAFSRKNAWESLPRPLRRLSGPLFGAFRPERILGRRFRHAQAFVADAQWWPAERSREYQLARLRELCTVAYQRSPYYRRTFDANGFRPTDLKSVDDVQYLPVLDRQTVRDYADDLLVVSPRLPHVDAVSTSGTSGMPLRFYIGADRSAAEYAHITSGWQRTGYRLDQPMAVLKGHLVPADRSGFRHEYDPVLRRHYYSTFHLSDDQLQQYLDHIATLGDCYLLAYPSVVAAVIRFLRRAGRAAPHNIRAIIAESEIVYAEQRRAAEETFGCRYFSLYGLTEKVVAAAECEASAAAHVWPTYGLFELLDERGRPITEPGQRGEIVGTSFLNTVAPFIRYRTGDFATYVADRCQACGREHVLIEDIRGHRAQEYLVALDGSLIPWSAVNMHDDTFLHVERFQFFQERRGVAVLRIIPGRMFTTTDRDRILRNLGRKLAGRIDLTVELVDALPLTERGKAIYVDQRLAIVPRAERIA
jgi:phenylacetate-coenzyme A ligase PaaK-like adenylate-forming protein